MFFADKIISIKDNDYVLEIGPGSTPHPRANVFLEKKYENEDEFYEQRGKTEFLILEKKTIYYEGEQFPFKDNEFDYIICSHVLEHVENIDLFIKEMCRVAPKGYIEYPTIYYDYIYNFDVHLTFLYYSNEILYWLPKKNTPLNYFKPVHSLFYKSLDSQYYDFVNSHKEYFFQGFEWFSSIKTEKTEKIEKLCYSADFEIKPLIKNKIEKIIYIEKKLSIKDCLIKAFKKIKILCFSKQRLI